MLLLLYVVVSRFSLSSFTFSVPKLCKSVGRRFYFIYNLHLPNGRFVFTFFTACDFGQASWEDNAAVEFSVSEKLSLARQKLKKITG